MADVKKDKTGSGEVLIVDADPDGKEVSQKIFEDLGYSVVGADTGNQVFKIIDERPWSWLPKAIFVDLLIPGLSGCELIRRLSERYEDKKMLLVATSGLCASEDITEAQLAGARVFLKKPFTAQSAEKGLQAGFKTLDKNSSIKRSIISILD
jgi:CheY-like chemotaxis protein